MPDQTTTTQKVQIGVEATPGTLVPATRRLLSLMLSLGPQGDINTFRPSGSKYPAIAAMGKEWAGGDVEGWPTYTELMYIISNVLGVPTTTTPGGATLARDHVWPIRSSELNTPQTWSVEKGSSTQARKAAYGLFTELGLTYNRDEISLDGSFMARILDAAATLTPAQGSAVTITSSSVAKPTVITTATAHGLTTGDVVTIAGHSGSTPSINGEHTVTVTSTTQFTIPVNVTTGGTGGTVTKNGVTELSLVPLLPREVSIYLDTTFGAIGTTKLLRVLEASWSLGDQYTGLWPLDAAQSSFAATYEGEPSSEVGLTLGADAVGYGLLTPMRAGDTRYLRIENIGGEIEAGFDYEFVVDLPIKITEVPDESDDDGLETLEYGAELFHDTAMGNAGSIRLRNGLAAL